MPVTSRLGHVKFVSGRLLPYNRHICFRCFLLFTAFLLLCGASKSPQGKTAAVKLFVILVEDNGKRGERIGCGDSVFPITKRVNVSKGHIRAALTALFALGDNLPSGEKYYNSVKQSDISVDRIILEKGAAKVCRVYLKGNLSIGGSCDSPRVEAQLRRTITQFPNVKKARIFLNGKPLEEAQSH